MKKPFENGTESYFESVGWTIYRQLSQSSYIETNLSTLSAYWPELQLVFARMCGWLGNEWKLPKHKHSPAEEFLRACAALTENSPKGRSGQARYLFEVYEAVIEAFASVAGFNVTFNGHPWGALEQPFVETWKNQKETNGRIKLSVRESRSNTTYIAPSEMDWHPESPLDQIYTKNLWRLTRKSALACTTQPTAA